MYTRKQALALARQLRTCPPLKVKQNLEHAEQFRRHLAVCPFCSTMLKDEIEAWEILSEKLEADFTVSPENSPIQTGQVRILDPELSFWQGDDYYNAPQAALLEIKPGGMVTLAQVWPDTALAGPGDLVPPENMIQGLSEILIQTWNIYTLPERFMGPLLGTLAPKVIESALKMAKDPDHLPEWALKPMPMQDHDPRIFFRELELKIGQAFAAMAPGRTAAEHEKRPVPIGLEALKAKLEEKFTGIGWDWPPGTVEECMALLRFPSHVLPMRAAENDGLTITAGYFCFNQEGMQDARPIECNIKYEASPPASYSVNGVIEGLPDDIPEDAFQCYIKDENNRLLMACKWVWEGHGKRFMALFDRPLSPGQSLAVFIVHHTGWDLP